MKRSISYFFIKIIMTQQNILIKASGDVVEQWEFHELCKKKASETSWQVVVICGSWKQINTKLEEAWYPIEYNEQWERVIWDKHQEQIVRNTLRETRDTLQGVFEGVDNVHVKWSWEVVWWVFCHINADTFIFSYYLWFDKIYIITFPGNKRKKIERYREYQKVEILEL